MKKISILAAASLLVLAACEPTPPAPTGPYPAEFKAAFTKACIKSLAEDPEIPAKVATSYCGCFINSIEKQVPISKFINDLESQRPLLKRSPYNSIARTCAIGAWN